MVYLLGVYDAWTIAEVVQIIYAGFGIKNHQNGHRCPIKTGQSTVVIK